MNSSQNSTLEGLNALIFEKNKPVLIFITFFMLFGIIGNSLVIYIYNFRMKSSTLKVFILYLGLVDMLGCCIGVPLDIVKLTLSLMYPWDFLCRSHLFTLYFSCISSVWSLFVIAVERYNRVCRPLATQASTQHAKWIVIGVTVFSLLAAVPTGLAYQRMEMPLDNGLTSHQCRSKIPLYWKVSFLMLLSMFLIQLIIIFVLYLFIWKQARRHFRQLEARRLKQIKDEANDLTQSNHHEIKHRSTQINMTIFSITVLFVVSFVPSFIINIVRPKPTQKTYALLMIIRRLWVLNSSLNPVVYGLCNGEFRLEFKRLFSEIKQKTSNMGTKSDNISPDFS